MTRMIPVDKIEQYQRLVERKASLQRSIENIHEVRECLRVADSNSTGDLFKVGCTLSGAELARVVIAKLNDMIVEADIEIENLCVDTDE